MVVQFELFGESAITNVIFVSPMLNEISCQYLRIFCVPCLMTGVLLEFSSLFFARISCCALSERSS